MISGRTPVSQQLFHIYARRISINAKKKWIRLTRYPVSCQEMNFLCNNIYKKYPRIETKTVEIPFETESD